MRNVLSILILLLSVTFFAASCGSNDDNDDPKEEACSLTAPNGSCSEGKVCNNGICELKTVDNSCSPSNPGGTCEAGKTCVNGTCKPKADNACSPTAPNGTCEAGKVCNNGVCELENQYTCSPSVPNGTCKTGEACVNGVCKVDNTCTPDCSGKICGNDGCGNSCGTCNGNETCTAAGQCEVETSNICSASNPTGTCEAGEVCNNGVCELVGSDGGVGSACTANGNECTNGGSCQPDVTDNGYCSAPCETNGGTCLGDGYCYVNGQNSFCYKTCTVGNDSTCGRAGLVCERASQTQGICIEACSTNADCSSDGSYVCNTGTGHCDLAPSECNVVTSAGCDNNKACYQQPDGSKVCYQAGTATQGQACTYLNDCVLGLICVGPASGPSACEVLCDTENTCESGNCQMFPDETFGACAPQR